MTTMKASSESSNYDYDVMLDEDQYGRPYLPPVSSAVKVVGRPRKENTVVYMEIYSAGGRRLKNGTLYLDDICYSSIVVLLITYCISYFIYDYPFKLMKYMNYNQTVGNITPPQDLGKLYFELRYDIAPVCCANFEGLITGMKGVGKDGVKYHYKGVITIIYV